MFSLAKQDLANEVNLPKVLNIHDFINTLPIEILSRGFHVKNIHMNRNVQNIEIGGSFKHDHWSKIWI